MSGPASGVAAPFNPEHLTTPKRRYLAFDIETAKEVPEDREDLARHRPLGIACAATLADDEAPSLWCGQDARGRPGDRMSQPEVKALVAYLTQMTEAGYTLLTWNGLGFDLDILAEESGEHEKCSRLAMHHVDMMFHAFCQLGHPVGLDRAASAMGLAGKTPGMEGVQAPQMWAAGRRQEVLSYVAQDVRVTLGLAQACEAQQRLCWLARSGTIRSMPLPTGWLSVADALQLPEPDTSWMSSPWPRSRFTQWLC